MRLVGFVSFFALALQAGVVEDVRSALAGGDFGRAAAIAQAYRDRRGTTPELAEAVSWIGRAALASKRYDEAIRYAEQVRDLVENSTARPRRRDPRLQTAMGASIEVRAQAMAAKGERDQAVALLRTELDRWSPNHPIVATRIQKNLNLLTLEGKPAPPVPGLVRGKPAIVFLWAHWCSDCKAEAAVLRQIRQVYGDRVALLAPTQLYGYAAGGEDAKPAEETAYIRATWAKFYGDLGATPTISGATFRRYGASTTPTIVVVDARGVVRLYHPGALTFDELNEYVKRAAQGRPGGRPAGQGARPPGYSRR